MGDRYVKYIFPGDTEELFDAQLFDPNAIGGRIVETRSSDDGSLPFHIMETVDDEVISLRAPFISTDEEKLAS